MAEMKDYFLKLEKLAWDAVGCGAVTDEEIFIYVSEWVAVEYETIKYMVRQMLVEGVNDSGRLVLH